MQATITNLRSKVLLAALTLAMAVGVALADSDPARADHYASGNYGPYSVRYPASVSCGFMNTEITMVPPDVRPAQGRSVQWVAWRPVEYFWNTNTARWQRGSINYAWHTGYARKDSGPYVNGYWKRISIYPPRGLAYAMAAEIKWYNPNTRRWDGHVIDMFRDYFNGSGGYCDFRNR